MANFGFKASQAVNDVLTATDDKLIVTTKYNCPKVVEATADTIVVSGGSGTKVINHNLGYSPLCLVYAEIVAGDDKRNLINPVVLNGNKFGYKVNTTELIVETIDTASNATYDFFDYIFNETL